MLDVLRTRLSQKHRTMRYPDGPPPELPERFAGRPVIAAGCAPGCSRCAAASARPTPCARPPKACAWTRAAACSAATASPPARAAPSPSGGSTAWPPPGGRTLIVGPGDPPSAAARHALAARLFGRSLQAAPGVSRRLQRLRGRHQRARHARLGHGALRHPVRRLAAPRRRPAGHRPGHREHAPGAREDLRRRADPQDRDRGGGLRRSPAALTPGTPSSRDGAAAVVPVDLFIPGCPPHPLTILDGLLRFLGRIPDEGQCLK